MFGEQTELRDSEKYMSPHTAEKSFTDTMQLVRHKKKCVKQDSTNNDNQETEWPHYIIT